jgi:dihydrofolate reductase
MGAVQYFTACTLDGFIADENNSLDWLFEAPHSDDDHFWEEWFPTVGALVMGATTYEETVKRHGLLESNEWWLEAFGGLPAWVFSHRELPLVPDVDVKLVEGDVRPVRSEAAARAGDANVWIVGGGDLVGQFYDAGLLDEIILSTTPVTLGKGAPLLPRRITSKNLAFRNADLIGQRIQIVLDVLAS